MTSAAIVGDCDAAAALAAAAAVIVGGRNAAAAVAAAPADAALAAAACGSGMGARKQQLDDGTPDILPPTETADDVRLRVRRPLNRMAIGETHLHPDPRLTKSLHIDQIAMGMRAAKLAERLQVVALEAHTQLHLHRHSCMLVEVPEAVAPPLLLRNSKEVGYKHRQCNVKNSTPIPPGTGNSK